MKKKKKKKLNCVIDTMVLRKANAKIDTAPRESSQFQKRINLLILLASGEMTVLYSERLITEYQQQVQEPRNDFVKAFLELLTHTTSQPNWDENWTVNKQKARHCRFPPEDDHVLRTAIHPDGSTIFSEEDRMLVTDACIHRTLDVHVKAPPGI